MTFPTSGKRSVPFFQCLELFCAVLLCGAGFSSAQRPDDALIRMDRGQIESNAIAAARARYPVLKDRPLTLWSLSYRWVHPDVFDGLSGLPATEPVRIDVTLLVKDSVTYDSPSVPASSSIGYHYVTVDVGLSAEGVVQSVNSGTGSRSRSNPAYVQPPPPVFPKRTFSSVAEFANDVLGFDFAAHGFGSPPELFAGFTRVPDPTSHDPLDPPPPVDTNRTRYTWSSHTNGYRGVVLTLTFATNRLTEVLIAMSPYRAYEAAYRFTELSGKQLTDPDLFFDDGRQRVTFYGNVNRPTAAVFVFTPSTGAKVDAMSRQRAPGSEGLP